MTTFSNRGDLTPAWSIDSAMGTTSALLLGLRPALGGLLRYSSILIRRERSGYER